MLKKNKKNNKKKVNKASRSQKMKAKVTKADIIQFLITKLYIKEKNNTWMPISRKWDYHS